MKIISFCSLALVVASAFCLQLCTSEPFSGNIYRKRKVKANKNRKLPHQVGILLKDNEGETSWCGGSLISNEWVLTAAHCIEDVEEATIYLGSRRRQSAKVEQKVNKTDFVPHPDWDSENIENDIALIRIPYTGYTENIKAVKLPKADGLKHTYDFDSVFTSGWGNDSRASSGPRVNLGWTDMYVLTNEICRDQYYHFLKESTLCATTYGSAAACRSDSGGPLVLKSGTIQIGVLSFGAPRGCARAPIVFTRVTVYLDWLNSQIRAKSAKKKNLK